MPLSNHCPIYLTFLLIGSKSPPNELDHPSSCSGLSISENELAWQARLRFERSARALTDI